MTSSITFFTVSKVSEGPVYSRLLDYLRELVAELFW